MSVPRSEASDSGAFEQSVTPPPRSASSTGRGLAVSSTRLIGDGDSVARNAFRVGLREDTPLPVASTLLHRMTPVPGTAGITQELDPNDILEVQDVAAAIARAEMLLASPAPPRSMTTGRPDIFETLGRRATDDTAGPATPAPPYASLPTPVPPRYVTMPAVVPSPEDDAFYHPVGRMRSLADVTLDGYRPEPTLLVRAATRRKRFSWILVAVLLPLLVLAAIALSATWDTRADASVAGTTLSLATRTPATAAPGRTSLTASSAVAKAPALHEPAQPASMPVFDVNSLPPARPRR